jgi:hypothetical protein|nr:MAG TPA: head closure knob [Caudoviricetes sp.]DAP88913.1 MAG TPA: head closure knob [Caudoviricetes sp.]
MVDAWKQARKAVESRYKGLCDILEKRKVKDEVTKATVLRDTAVLSNQPCRLSYSSSGTANQTDTVSNIEQTIKLFIAPEIKIAPGSKLRITQNGITTDYISSGVPAVYETHQEVSLELEKENA